MEQYIKSNTTNLISSGKKYLVQITDGQITPGAQEVLYKRSLDQLQCLKTGFRNNFTYL